MALTLKAEQRLEDVGLVKFYGEHEATWRVAALESYRFVQERFPDASAVRRDDIAQVLKPVLEVNQLLRDELADSKLRQKFWYSDFTDLIIDRLWDWIKTEAENDEKAKGSA